MTDTLSRQKRSEVMSLVHSNGNQSTEIRMVRLLRTSHIRGWRRKARLIGKPDFLFEQARLAVFIDGCFWHGCSVHFRRPKSNQAYWDQKVHSNRTRDLEITKKLKDKGWHVLRIWEHELKSSRSIERVIRKLIRELARR